MLQQSAHVILAIRRRRQQHVRGRVDLLRVTIPQLAGRFDNLGIVLEARGLLALGLCFAILLPVIACLYVLGVIGEMLRN